MITKEEQLRLLRRDVENVLIQKKWINKKINNTFDPTRILGVVAAKDGAENYLSCTIPKIVKQINGTGFNADIIVGLNNGFECPSVVDKAAAMPGSQIIHLYTTNKIDRAIPAIIFDNTELSGQPYRIKETSHKRNRIFFAHQKNEALASGKVRVLLDIYQLLLDSIAVGWTPPLFTIAFDAETMFLMAGKNGIPDIGSNGLRLLINEIASNPEVDILGARLMNVAYTKQTAANRSEIFWPEFSKLIPPVQHFINLVHGKYNRYSWKPGGGTIGRTDAMISLLFVISKSYPGTIGEDAHTTVLAHHAGFRGGIRKDVVITNRCPDMTDVTGNNHAELAWQKQMIRWFVARRTLERKYGRKNLKLIAGYRFPLNVIIGAVEILKELKSANTTEIPASIKKIWLLLKAIIISIKLRKAVLKNSELFNDTGDNTFW